MQDGDCDIDSRVVRKHPEGCLVMPVVMPIPHIATRQSWKVLPLPEIRADLGFAESYTTADFELIKRGLIPDEMEDKWFIFI